jgi:hypothetical protein
MSINPDVMRQIRHELSTAPHGHKTEIVRRRAAMYQVAPATLYRQLEMGGPSRKSDPVRPELREWAKIVAGVKKRPPEEAGEISTDQAVRIAIEAKLLPVEAMNTAPSTFDRIMREIGTAKRAIRANRFQAKDPNQAHHFDASSSAFFFVARRMPDGEYILKMHRPAAGDYKNKPVPVDGLRPWYYGACDDHSGVKFARLIVGHGENGPDSIAALDEFWRVLGVPKRLLSDQGMLKKNLATNAYVHACGVDLPQMRPYAKRGHGKIESPWKTQWQRFEKPFYAVDEWNKYEIPVTEMNRRLYLYMEEENQRPHRFERNITRMDAWRRVMLQGGIVKLPEDALSRAHTMDKRKVGIDGLIYLDNVIYEVKGLHEAWAYIYRSMFEDKMVAEDVETGERYEVKDFKPLDEGEFRAHKDTPHQVAVKEGAELSIGPEALPFQQSEIRNPKSKIVSLPIKETVREVENVFDVEHYSSIEEAMCEFDGLFLATQDRVAIEGVIKENKMDKAFVRELAQEIRGEIEVRKSAI